MRPWRESRWLADRISETIYHSLAIVPLAFWASLLSLIYTAIFTQRPTADLQLVTLGLAGLHAGRRTAEKWIETEKNGSRTQTTQDKP